MNKNFLLACNFKNNIVDAKEYKANFGKNVYSNIVICPNFCELALFENLKSNGIKLGAQNVSEFVVGSHTGEINIEMLKKYGADYCIVGHSERRHDFGETHFQINAKLKLLIENNITPILCVGESVANDMSQIDFAKNIVKTQLEAELIDIDKKDLIVAYEPIWSIGTGKVADVPHITEICKFIKQNFDVSKVLYGGSVNANNINEISKIEYVDGVLIGKASLNSNNVIEMLKNID